MDGTSIVEAVVFVLYLCCMVGIGIYFFIKTRNGGEKTYFLGDRKMSPWVAGLSAGASDMSAWVLMGLPTSIYALGMGQAWIAIGLLIGYALSWLLEAPRLRKFSVVCNDSITIPQYLTNRFLSSSKVLQVVCAVVFLFAYTIYAASSVKACGTLFNTVLGIDATVAMYVAAAIIIVYTFLGGFNAVCWTDFFQGMLILAALLFVPLFAATLVDFSNTAAALEGTPNFWNPMADWRDIVSGLAWGIGYFGMPHIIIRFMSLRSQHEMKKSAAIGIAWTTCILFFSCFVGIIGRMYLGFDEAINGQSLVFIQMVRNLFPAVLAGILLSAVLAASMSTADSQLLAAGSAFASDVYKPIIRKGEAGDKEMFWAGRYVVLAIAVIAVVIAANPNSGSIMNLVSNAWGVFGAAFGPAIMMSLFWKRFTFSGAVASIVVGAVVDVCWLVFLSGTGIYEILPGALAGLLVGYLVSKFGAAPSTEVEKLYDSAVAYED